MYVPVNVNVFLAAYEGTFAGMALAGRNPTSAAAYAGQSIVAGSFAQEFDTVWGAAPATQFTVDAIRENCETYWETRGSTNIDPTAYATAVAVIVAAVVAEQSYLIAQGITPPPIPGAQNYLQTGIQTLAADITIPAGSSTLLGLTLHGTKAGSKFLFQASASSVGSVSGIAATFGIYVDGTPIAGSFRSYQYLDPNRYEDFSMNQGITGLAAGDHTFEIRGGVSAGVAIFWPVTFPTLFGASLIVSEVAQ